MTISLKNTAPAPVSITGWHDQDGTLYLNGLKFEPSEALRLADYIIASQPATVADEEPALTTDESGAVVADTTPTAAQSGDGSIPSVIGDN